jgi:SAM-dependent methyltransferase
MIIHRLHSFEDYRRHVARMERIYAERRMLERDLQKNHSRAFTVAGFSYPARQEVKFRADFTYSNGTDVNWREWLVCPVTGLNNRLRAAVHLADSELGLLPSDAVYLTEQVTPLFRYLGSRYADLVGSEYLGEKLPRGAADSRGVRNEDLTRLTFPDESFDVLLSFDCFEHMPDFVAGMREVARVLKPGGRMMWTVPFRADLQRNLVRASLGAGGEFVHHEPPEYHGDPINAAGCLCFTHFGWEMLAQVKEAGFNDAYALAYWSDIFGYLGVEQFVFVAVK